MPNNADLRTVLAYEAIKGEFDAEIATLKKENAELRRWLGEAAKSIRFFSDPHQDGIDARIATICRSLSRGEEIAPDVRRLYLGDDKP